MMIRPIKIESIPLYVKAKEAILKLINDNFFTENKLPSETELSKLMGISRTTIREALAALQREGVITKQHGLGNLIHQSTLKTKMQIDKFSDFRNLLEDGGYNVEITRSGLQLIDNLEIYGLSDPTHSDKEKYVYLESIFSADKHPAILSRNFIRESILRKNILSEMNNLNSSFGDLLNRFSKEEVANTIICFKPSSAEGLVSDILHLPLGVPVMQWQETSYSIFDRIICISKVTFHPDLVNLTLLRKWK